MIPGPSASLVLTLQACWETNKARSQGPSFHCLLQTPSVCVCCNYPSTPLPQAVVEAPVPSDLEGRGYYNLQNLKLRMNKSSVACHF